MKRHVRDVAFHAQCCVCVTRDGDRAAVVHVGQRSLEMTGRELRALYLALREMWEDPNLESVEVRQ